MEAKILIVEDEILIAEDIKETLLGLGFKDVIMAHDLESAMFSITHDNPQVVLLDIRLENEKDGIQIGAFLAQQENTQFIYVTAHSDVEMVKEILQTKPAGYITKPVKQSDLFASVSLALGKFEAATRENPTFTIKDGYESIIIPLKSIRFIEAEGNYLNVYCDDKKHVIRQSLENFLKETNSSIFFRIHRSFAVNIQKVVRYSKKEIVLSDHTTLPISRNIKDDFELFMTNLKG
jgi:two-component system, LytTR family, response regulator LytT